MSSLRRPEFFWPIVWGAAALALAALLVAEYEFGKVDVGSGARAPAKIVEARLLPPFELPLEAQVAPETAARPMFVPARRPSPPATTASAPVMRKGQFVLTGVTVTPEASFVFLKETATGKTQSVKKGSLVNGLMVDVVEPRRVVLRQGEETEDLVLIIQVPARVATAAPAPAPGAPAAFGAPQFPSGMPAAGTVPAMPGAVPAGPGAQQSALGGVPPAPGASSSVPVVAAPKTDAAGTQPPAAAPATGRRRPWINAQ